MSGTLDVTSPLRRAWLRELGIERVWPATAPAQPQAQGSAETAASQRNTAATAAVSTRPEAASVVAEAPVPASPGGTDAAVQAPASVASHDAPADAAGTAAPASTRPAGRVIGPAQLYRDTLASMAAAPRNTGTPVPTEAEVKSWGTGDPDADWEALQREVSVCTACALSKTRTNAVFGSGPRSAEWLVIGEGPGEQEDRQGLPFVGRSGRLLENMLNSIGVDRSRGDVFITNIVKCRPPGNRNPEPEEAAACRPYLERQVALLSPKRALSVGRVSAQNVLGTDATIGSLRGRVHRLALGGKDIPMVVSYHPAYLLRAPLEKSKAWHDLQRVSGIDEPQ
jgi:DNA polymerase